MLKFEIWCESASQPELEIFLAEHELPAEICHGMRKTMAMENNLRFMASENQSMGAMAAQFDLTDVVIDNYKLIKKLGSGGMGTVWLAEQIEPVRREVAIKLIRPGLDSETISRRFAAERQALAMMSHPHIANFLDAGTFDFDRPYFVMEHVPGITITDYCNAQKLSLHDRLNLFLQLCDAIQHAHQKSLLHRDIKPTNVLVQDVDGSAHLKVIDFGLAKFFSNELWETNITRHKAAIGSPLWMSPEQANSGNDEAFDVDTRTDIYSLGVILFQLLTNTTPITEEFFDKATPVAFMAAIQEQALPYPSSRLSQSESRSDWVLECTGSSLTSWKRQLRNDLDWITLKALAKDRERRYPTVAALADDIRRFMDGTPVSAGPPSRLYRARKLISKYRVAACTTLAIAALLISAVITTSTFAFRANKQKQLADLQRLRTENSLDFIIHSFGNLNPSNPGVEFNEFKIEYLMWLANQLDVTNFEDAPSTESSLRIALARALSGAGLHEKAAREFELAIAINSRLSEQSSKETLNAKNQLVKEYLKCNYIEKALVLADKCIAEATASLGSEHEISIGANIALGEAILRQGNLDPLIPQMENLVEFISQAFGKDHPHHVEAQAVLANALHRTENYEAASARFALARESATRIWGPDFRRTIELEALYWEACARDFRFKKSPQDLIAFVNRVCGKFGPKHPVTHTLRDNCGAILLQYGQPELTLKLFNDNYSHCLEHYGAKDLHTARAAQRLAILTSQMGDHEVAARLFRESKFTFEVKLGAKSNEYIELNYQMGEMYFQQSEFTKALKHADKFLVYSINHLGLNAQTTFDLLDLKARCLVEMGRADMALPIFEDCWERNQRKTNSPASQTCQWLRRLATVSFLSGNLQEAIRYYQRAFNINESEYGIRNSMSQRLLGQLQNCYMLEGQYMKAESQSRYLLNNLEPGSPGHKAYFAWGKTSLADALINLQKLKRRSRLPVNCSLPPYVFGRVATRDGASPMCSRNLPVGRRQI